MDTTQQVSTFSVVMQAMGAVGTLVLGSLTFYWLYLRRHRRHKERTDELSADLQVYKELRDFQLSTAPNIHERQRIERRLSQATHLHIEWMYFEMERLYWEQWEDERAHDKALLRQVRWPPYLSTSKKLLWGIYKLLVWICFLVVVGIACLFGWFLLVSRKAHPPNPLAPFAVSALYITLVSLIAYSLNVAAARLTVPDRARRSFLDKF